MLKTFTKENICCPVGFFEKLMQCSHEKTQIAIEIANISKFTYFSRFHANLKKYSKKNIQLER